METTSQAPNPFWSLDWKNTLGNFYQLGVKPEYDHFLRSSIIYFNYDVVFGILLLISSEIVFLFLQPQGIDLVHQLSLGYLAFSILSLILNARHQHALSVFVMSTYAIIFVTMLSGYYGERANIHFLLFIFGFSPVIHLSRNFTLAIILSALFIGAYLFLVLMDFTFFPAVQLPELTVDVIRKFSYPIILSAFLYKVLLTIFMYSESIDALYYKNERLVKSEATLSSVFQNTTDSVFAIDHNNQLRAFNNVAGKEFEEWFNLRLYEGMNIFDRIPHSIREELEPVIQNVRDGIPTSFDFEQYVGGELNTYVLSFTPIFNRYGEVIGVTGFSKNVTKFRRAQADLIEKAKEIQVKNRELERYIESNMQLENFASMASHDLKEPLRAVIIYSQLLEKKYSDLLDDDGREYLNFITSSSSDMNKMINDLLAYAKINTQSTPVEVVDFDNLLELVAFRLKEDIEQAGAIITSENLPKSIYAIPGSIKQVFQNLISNAIKFQPEGNVPRIHVEGIEKPRFWKIIVSDNGIGIKDKFHEEVFLLFRKLHSKRQYEGTGIGLAICKRIIELHRGHIWVDSNTESGTTFCFTISKELSA